MQIGGGEEDGEDQPFGGAGGSRGGASRSRLVSADAGGSGTSCEGDLSWSKRQNSLCSRRRRVRRDRQRHVRYRPHRGNTLPSHRQRYVRPNSFLLAQRQEYSLFGLQHNRTNRGRIRDLHHQRRWWVSPESPTMIRQTPVLPGGVARSGSSPPDPKQWGSRGRKPGAQRLRALFLLAFLALSLSGPVSSHPWSPECVEG